MEMGADRHRIQIAPIDLQCLHVASFVAVSLSVGLVGREAHQSGRHPCKVGCAHQFREPRMAAIVRNSSDLGKVSGAHPAPLEGPSAATSSHPHGLNMLRADGSCREGSFAGGIGQRLAAISDRDCFVEEFRAVGGAEHRFAAAVEAIKPRPTLRGSERFARAAKNCRGSAKFPCGGLTAGGEPAT